jgi:hypothetical protein
MTGDEANIINIYIFFNDDSVLGTVHGNNVDEAYMKIFGMPYNLNNSKKIFYRIIGRLEEAD